MQNLGRFHVLSSHAGGGFVAQEMSCRGVACTRFANFLVVDDSGVEGLGRLRRGAWGFGAQLRFAVFDDGAGRQRVPSYAGEPRQFLRTLPEQGG